MKKGSLAVLLILLVATAVYAQTTYEISPETIAGPARCYFDAAGKSDMSALRACFKDEAVIIDVSRKIAGMRFNGPEETVAFAERDIWGGKYKVEKVFEQGDKEIVHCRFWPKGWSSPEPPIEYQFQTKNGKITNWFGKYR